MEVHNTIHFLNPYPREANIVLCFVYVVGIVRKKGGPGKDGWMEENVAPPVTHTFFIFASK